MLLNFPKEFKKYRKRLSVRAKTGFVGELKYRKRVIKNVTLSNIYIKKVNLCRKDRNFRIKMCPIGKMNWMIAPGIVESNSLVFVITGNYLTSAITGEHDFSGVPFALHSKDNISQDGTDYFFSIEMDTKGKIGKYELKNENILAHTLKFKGFVSK